MTEAGKSILITGGSGLVGTALAERLLQTGYSVMILGRGIPKNPDPRIRYFKWDIERGDLDEAAIRIADQVVHLAGAGVMDQKWSDDYKSQIVNSRVNSGKLLAASIQNIPNQIQRVISASAIGWYGQDQEPLHPFTENDPAATDFLGDCCQQWESSMHAIDDVVGQKVILRFGIVLSAKGGALAEFIKPLRFGLAAIMGQGQQATSWIHIDDLCHLLMHCMEQHMQAGVYNAVAPHPVQHSALIDAMKKASGKRSITAHVPAWLLRLVLGEQSIEILKSCTVSSQKISATGFSFHFPRIEEAMADLMGKP